MSGGRFGPNGIGYARGFDRHSYVMIRMDILQDEAFDREAALIECQRVIDLPDEDYSGSARPQRDPIAARGRHCAVYRFYDAAGTLLYVGKAIDPDSRQKNHERRVWWADVDQTRTTRTWFENERLALDAEDLAIRDENPLYNRVGGGRA